MNDISTIKLKNVTYNIIDPSKADKSHTHTKSDITDLSLDWEQIENKPTKLSEFENDCQFITKVDLKASILINLVTESGDASDLIGASVQVTVNGETTLDTTWQGATITTTASIGATYKVVVGEVTGYYRYVIDQSGTAAAGATYSCTFNYGTEVVTVNVAGITDLQPTITINGTAYTWTGSPIKAKVPTNTKYSIVGNQINVYKSVSLGPYTAGQSPREVTLTYSTIETGVYIYTKQDTLVSAADWNSSNNTNAVGVYVGTDLCRFIIAPEDASTSAVWGTYGTSVSSAYTTTTASNAQTDYAGQANTAAIISQDTSTSNKAADYCNSYTFKNGKTGYLPALGEWYIAYNNQSAIGTAMSKIGGTALTTSSYYWSSTQWSSYGAWLLNWNYGSVDYNPKAYSYYVRAFCAV